MGFNSLPTLAAILSIMLLAYSTSSVSGYTTSEIKVWCSQTPYPLPCEYFLSQNPNNGYQAPLTKKSEFLSLSMKLALDRSLTAKSNTYSLGNKCKTPKEKAAWADCVELYEQIVEKLNKTYVPITPCSQVDKQTWLSTALTNLETCQAGFVELGLTGDGIYPLMSNNVSMLVSNTLALNHAPENDNTIPTTNGFPKWVRPGERKLLQSGSPTANVVVAKDGSGKYKTVAAAVAAAPGSGRFVIRVKAGVYNENVQIKKKNIMLLGDGIGKTIITGSKSVGGGTTTFNSATVGK